MSTISLVLTDLDGTVVLPGKNEVSEKVRKAVIACENKGISVVPVTGRPYEMAKGAMEVLGFDDLCVLDGGASIRKVISGELVWSRWLETEVLKEIVTAILPFAVEVIDCFPTQIELEPSAIDIEAIVEPAPYVFAALRNEDSDAIEAALSGIEGIVAHIMPSWMGRSELSGVQVTHVEADKYHGVAELLTIVGVSKEHVLGIGDSNNDLPLFRNAGLKIAMGNATDKLKAVSDHVVGTVDEDGFAEAMERFVLG